MAKGHDNEIAWALEIDPEAVPFWLWALNCNVKTYESGFSTKSYSITILLMWAFLHSE
jgi:hypothetical protein